MTSSSPRTRINQKTLEQDIYAINNFLAQNQAYQAPLTQEDIRLRREYIARNQHNSRYSSLFYAWERAMNRYEVHALSIREQIRNQSDDLGRNIDQSEWEGEIREEALSNDINFSTVKNDIESAIEDQIDPTEFLELIHVLRNIPDGRAERLFAMRYIFDRMARDGYIVEMTNTHVQVTALNPDNAQEAKIFSRHLREAVDNGTITRTNMMHSLMVGTSDWNKYTETFQKNNPKLAVYARRLFRKYNITTRIPQDQIQVVRGMRKMHPEDKAFLLSYIQGGIDTREAPWAVSLYRDATDEMITWIQSLESWNVQEAYQHVIPRENLQKLASTAPEQVKRVAQYPTTQGIMDFVSAFPQLSTLLLVAIFIAGGKGFWLKKNHDWSFFRAIWYTTGLLVLTTLGCGASNELKRVHGSYGCSDLLDWIKKTAPNRRKHTQTETTSAAWPSIQDHKNTQRLPYSENRDTLMFWLLKSDDQEVARSEKNQSDIRRMENIPVFLIYAYIYAPSGDESIRIATEIYKALGVTDPSTIALNDLLDPEHIPARYALALNAHEAITILKTKNHDRYSRMTLKEMEQYILAWYRDNNTSDASEGAKTLTSESHPQHTIMQKEWEERLDLSESAEIEALSRMSISYDIEGKISLLWPDGIETPYSVMSIAGYLGITPEKLAQLEQTNRDFQDFTVLFWALMSHEGDYGEFVKPLTHAVETMQNHLESQSLTPFSVQTYIENALNTVKISLPFMARDSERREFRYRHSRRAKIRALFQETDRGKRMMNILNFIRDELGQGDEVANMLIRDGTGLNFSLPTYEDLQNGNWRNVGEYTASQEAAIEKALNSTEQDIQKNLNKHYHTITWQIRAQYPGVEIDRDKIEKIYHRLMLTTAAHRAIAFEKLAELKNSDHTPQSKLLADILGVGPFDFSDRTWNLASTVWEMLLWEAAAIVVGLVTVWVWTAAVRWAAITRYPFLLQRFNSMGMLARWSVRGALFAAETSAFYTMYTLTKHKSLSQWKFSELLQSGAMFGVLRLTHKILRQIPWLTLQGNLISLKNTAKFGTKVVIDGLALSGVSSLFQYDDAWDLSISFDFSENWTVEEFTTALLMAWLFRTGVAASRKVIAFQAQKSAGVIHVEPQLGMMLHQHNGRFINTVQPIKEMNPIPFKHNGNNYQIQFDTSTKTWQVLQRHPDRSMTLVDASHYTWAWTWSFREKVESRISKNIFGSHTNIPKHGFVLDGNKLHMQIYPQGIDARIQTYHSYLNEKIQNSQNAQLKKMWWSMLRTPIASVDELATLWARYPDLARSTLVKRTIHTLRLITTWPKWAPGSWWYDKLKKIFVATGATTILTLFNPNDTFGVEELAEVPLYLMGWAVALMVSAWITAHNISHSGDPQESDVVIIHDPDREN